MNTLNEKIVEKLMKYAREKKACYNIFDFTLEELKTLQNVGFNGCFIADNSENLSLHTGIGGAIDILETFEKEKENIKSRIEYGGEKYHEAITDAIKKEIEETGITIGSEGERIERLKREELERMEKDNLFEETGQKKIRSGGNNRKKTKGRRKR